MSGREHNISVCGCGGVKSRLISTAQISLLTVQLRVNFFVEGNAAVISNGRGTAVQMLHTVLGKKYSRCECSSSPTQALVLTAQALIHVQLSQLPANISGTVSAVIRAASVWADQLLQSGVHLTLRVVGLPLQDSLGTGSCGGLLHLSLGP